jgi:cytochrome o ubiquinol oxidase operon protein cyoD
MSDRTVHTHLAAEKKSLRAYSVGYGLSVVLTLTAYFVVTQPLLLKSMIVPAIIVLAIAQLFVQLFFFLHIGREGRPRWNLLVMLFAAGVVLIIVIGSLWIMGHLNYHLMSPQETKVYLNHHEGI